MTTDLEGIPILNDANDENDESSSLLLQRHGICCVKLPDDFDTQRWSAEFSQVTPMNLQFEGDGEYAFYRNIMDEEEFPFDSMVRNSTAIGRAILQNFPVQDLSELRLDDAFCVHYNMDQHDTSGAKHKDPSDITINMCLHKSKDTEGSYVLFYGTKKLSSTPIRNNEANDDDKPQPPLFDRFLVNQKPGYATIHFGDHLHETTPLVRGSRTNIVLTYWYTDTSRSDVATRTCY
jgi:hypothetical protein